LGCLARLEWVWGGLPRFNLNLPRFGEVQWSYLGSMDVWQPIYYLKIFLNYLTKQPWFMLPIGQQYQLAPMSIFSQNKQATSTRPWWFSIQNKHDTMEKISNSVMSTITNVL
jgi:hypothetical protein